MMMHGKAAAFYPTMGNPCPDGGQAFFVEPDEGVRVRAAFWPAGQRGTVIILPGRTEMIEKYFEIVGELSRRGFSAVVIDWRGQGASSRLRRNPLKGHVGDFAAFTKDLAAVLAHIETSVTQPFIVLGHSMGGNIATRALHDWPDRFQGAVLTSPMFGINVKAAPLLEMLAGLVPAGAFVPGGGDVDPYLERFATNPVTHDSRRFARALEIIRTYPALALGAPTWGWLRAALASARRTRTRRYLGAIKVPVLVMTAGIERLVDNRATARAVRRLPQATHVEIDAARHEILMESDEIRAEFWRHFDDFTVKLKL